MSTTTSSTTSSTQKLNEHGEIIPHDPSSHFKAEKLKAETTLIELEKEIDSIQREADHRTWGLKYDAATLRKKIKALDKQIEGK